MNDQYMQNKIHAAVNDCMSGLDHLPSQRDAIMYRIIEEEKTVKRKLSAAAILAIVLLSVSLTALAISLLTPKEVVEQIAVPLAQQNDDGDSRQESYTHDELAQLIQVLGENGFTIDENSKIIQAFRNGYGYWEEETITEICCQAFGGPINEWTIEEKYWFEEMMVEIGFAEYNCYLIPTEGDMTAAEARTYAVNRLNKEYDAHLPEVSDEKWRIDECFSQYRDEEGNLQPARWQFKYINRKTGTAEYIIEFTRDGEVVDISEAGFHGAVSKVDSFSLADRLIGDKYGSMIDMPIEGWVEFGQMIAGLTPTTANEWYHQHAGYRMPPKGAVQAEEVIQTVLNSLEETGQYDEFILCCQDGDIPIYKVNLRFLNADQTDYVSFWCAEVDCMTGVIRRIEPYYRIKSPAVMQFVPFSILGKAPQFNPDSEETDRESANLVRRDVYERYESQYQTMWYFWPLEAQKEALGPHHDLPQQGELTRDQAAETAINAVRERYGQAALDRLGNWQTGVICCRYPEKEGVRVVWEIYITGDPVTISNGYRVTFDDPHGVMFNHSIEIGRANSENN